MAIKAASKKNRRKPVTISIRFKDRNRVARIKEAAEDREQSFNKFVELAAIDAANQHFADKEPAPAPTGAQR